MYHECHMGHSVKCVWRMLPDNLLIMGKGECGLLVLYFFLPSSTAHSCLAAFQLPSPEQRYKCWHFYCMIHANAIPCGRTFVAR